MNLIKPMENIIVAKNTPKIKLTLFTPSLSFSLIELIFTLLILTILISFSISCYIKNISKNHSNIIIENIISTLTFAKHYAITNKTVVKICPSTDMKHCNYSQNWSTGCIVFADNKILKVQKFSRNKNFSLSLDTFHNNKKMIKIQTDGTTFNNGHFFYNNLNTNTHAYIYWNKQMRIYRSH